MTLRQSLIEAAATLGTDPHLHEHARRDAELLLLHVLRIDRATLLAYPDRPLTPQQMAACAAAIARRLRLEPIQYITGRQEFYGLELKVTPATLIPRPETEHLVEAVLQRLPGDQPLKILDIGTGTGAIALALAAHLPMARITALDLSAEALEVARENARVHHLDHLIRFVVSDLFDAISVSDRTGSFDVIVSNPPYVPETDRAGLHPQVRDHEPAQALFGGPEGLDIYRRMIPLAYTALRRGGLLALEIGEGQKEALTGLLAGWEDPIFIPDLQGIPRIALAVR